MRNEDFIIYIASKGFIPTVSGLGLIMFDRKNVRDRIILDTCTHSFTYYTVNLHGYSTKIGIYSLDRVCTVISRPFKLV